LVSTIVAKAFKLESVWLIRLVFAS
jgi:hypothetical protein